MPERLRLLIVLAAFVGLRRGELLELRRSDVDGVTGRINVTRKVDKDGPWGLLFPGDRTDHMSVRYLMDRYRPARKAAGRPDLTIHHLRQGRRTTPG